MLWSICNKSKTKDPVWSYFQTPKREWKLRRAAENFWQPSRFFGNVVKRSSIKPELRSKGKSMLKILLAFCWRPAIIRERELSKKAGKHQRSKQTGQYLCWKVVDSAHLILFYTHWLCMNYIIAMFLLVSCMSTVNLLCILPGFVQGETPSRPTKTYNKKIARLLNYFPNRTCENIQLRRTLPRDSWKIFRFPSVKNSSFTITMENLLSRQPSKWTNDHNAKKLKEKPGGHADHAQNEKNARPKRPPLRSFWSAARMVTSGKVQHRKSRFTDSPSLCACWDLSLRNLIGWGYETITPCMFKKLDLGTRCWPKEPRPLGTRMYNIV